MERKNAGDAVERSRPSARARRGATGSLPYLLSSFVGREREVAEVAALIARARLVTLTGAGGTGKTRLAIEAARRAAAGLETEALYVDLAPVGDADLIAPTIAALIGIEAEPGQRVTEALVAHFATRPWLLVFDNVEQLLPEAGATVLELTSSCPNLRILATSRAPMHVRGEHEYPVDPLIESEAETLFRERAEAAGARLEHAERTAIAVREICRRLDGLPLAIELAAARSRTLTPEALLRRLEHGASLPEGRSVDAPTRQRTVRDAIAWSYGLLDRVDQTVFAALAVFAGGFSSEAAIAVVGDLGATTDTVASLDRLVDQNLVRVAPDMQGEPRFSLLETIREFAQHLLDGPDLRQLRTRHARHFMRVLADRTDYGASPAADPIGDDLDNVRAALAWADESGDVEVVGSLGANSWVYFGVLGHRAEARRWLQAAERASATAEPVVRAALLVELAGYELAFGGDRRRAQEQLLRALAILEEAGDTARTTRVLESLSHVASDLGDRKTASERMRQAVDQVRAMDDRLRRARFLAELAMSGHAVHTVAEMKELAVEAVREGRDLDDPATLINALAAEGFIAIAEGKPAIAVHSLDEAAGLCKTVQADGTFITGGLAIAHIRDGDLEGSRGYLIETVRSAHTIGVDWLGLATLEACADWLGSAGQAELAVACWSAIDAARSRSLDRTPGNDMGLFTASRERDRSALTPSAYQTAIASGLALALDDALGFAISAIEATDPARSVRTSRSGGHFALTPRELEVLALVAAGRTDGQIAETLFISKKTAAVHVGNIKGKLGARSRVEIATIAIDQGFVPRAATSTTSTTRPPAR